MKKTIVLSLSFFLLIAAAAAQTDPAGIITAMERQMYPDSRTEMVLVSVAGTVREEYRLTSYARDNNQKIIVRFSAPADMVGRDLLMMERNVWIYDPRSGRDMKIPSNQGFGGTGFSYGDVLRLNFSDNYIPALLSESAASWTLELTQKQRDAPYYRIVLEISRDFRPVRGQCFSRAGELIKEMVYSNSGNAGNGVKPLTVTVSSPLDPEDYSTLTIVSERAKVYPDPIFNRRNLAARLEESY